MPQALPDAVALLVEAVATGVVAPEGGDVIDLVEALAVFDEIFLVVAAQVVSGESDGPPFLVVDLERGVEFLLSGRVRIDSMKDFPPQPRSGGEGELGLKVGERALTGMVEAVVGGEVERSEVA